MADLSKIISAGKVAMEVSKYLYEKLTESRYGKIGLEYSLVLMFPEVIPLGEIGKFEEVILKGMTPQFLGDGIYLVTYQDVDVLLRILYDLADDWLGEVIIMYDPITEIMEIEGPYVRKISIISNPITQTSIDKTITSMIKLFINISNNIRNDLSLRAYEVSIVYFIKIRSEEKTIMNIHKALQKEIEKKDLFKNIMEKIKVKAGEEHYIEIKLLPEEIVFMTQIIANTLKPKKVSFL